MINWPPDKPKRQEFRRAHHKLVETLGIIHPQMLDEIKASTRKNIGELIKMFRLEYDLSDNGDYCRLTVIYNGVYGGPTVIEKPYGIGTSQHSFEVPLFQQDVATALRLMFDDIRNGSGALHAIANNLSHDLWDTLEDRCSKECNWGQLQQYQEATKRGHRAITSGHLPQEITD